MYHPACSCSHSWRPVFTQLAGNFNSLCFISSCFSYTETKFLLKKPAFIFSAVVLLVWSIILKAKTSQLLCHHTSLRSNVLILTQTASCFLYRRVKKQLKEKPGSDCDSQQIMEHNLNMFLAPWNDSLMDIWGWKLSKYLLDVWSL